MSAAAKRGVLVLGTIALVAGGLWLLLARRRGEDRAVETSAASGRASLTTTSGPELTNAPPLPAGPPTGQKVRGPYRFLRAPVVVRWTPQIRGEPTLYEVYFRLNRRLAARGTPVLVILDGAVGFSPSGLGYEQDSRTGHCYAHAIDDSDHFRQSLRRSHDGQRVRVIVSVLQRPKGLLSITVPLSPRNLIDPAPGDANGQRFRSLGCAPQ